MAKFAESPGQVIGELMDAREITAYRLAQLTHLTQDAIRAVVKTGGHAMSIDSLRRICAAMGVSPCDVLDKLAPVVLGDMPARGKGRPRKVALPEEQAEAVETKKPAEKAGKKAK